MPYVKCPKCAGKGDEECWCVKRGKPDPLCDNCRGKGKVRCHSCDGKRTVWLGNKP